MDVSFVDLVEDVKRLSFEEKQELKDLIDNYLIEERREEIYRHYQASRQNLADEKLRFSSDINELEAMLDD